MAVTLTRKQINALSYEQLIELKTRLNDALEAKEEMKQKIPVTEKSLKGIHVVSNTLVSSARDDVWHILCGVFNTAALKNVKVKSLIRNNHFKVTFQLNQRVDAARCWDACVKGDSIVAKMNGTIYTLYEFGV